MTIDEMINILNTVKDAPFYDVLGAIDKNDYTKASEIISTYFNCDIETAQLCCYKIKATIYDKIFCPDPRLTPQQIEQVNREALDLLNKVHCPYCNSVRCRKISNIAKAGSVALFGIFSQKVKKQWHCDNCGSEW